MSRFHKNYSFQVSYALNSQVVKELSSYRFAQELHPRPILCKNNALGREWQIIIGENGHFLDCCRSLCRWSTHRCVGGMSLQRGGVLAVNGLVVVASSVVAVRYAAVEIAQQSVAVTWCFFVFLRNACWMVWF